MLVSSGVNMIFHFISISRWSEAVKFPLRFLLKSEKFISILGANERLQLNELREQCKQGWNGKLFCLCSAFWIANFVWTRSLRGWMCKLKYVACKWDLMTVMRKLFLLRIYDCDIEAPIKVWGWAEIEIFTCW